MSKIPLLIARILHRVLVKTRFTSILISVFRIVPVKLYGRL